ncbi:MAG: 3-dehydroquinate synthase, partial [Candidatus Aminicenantes bacterium]|nr:3-dehydroquinate synthase [Candidatus Aminicenantes bacterium]
YRIPHGEAVSLGMVLAAEISCNRGFLGPTEYRRLRSLLERFRLPVSFDFEKDLVYEAVAKDKKKRGEGIDFILLKSIGEASIENLRFEELKGEIDDLCESGKS